MCWHFRRHSTTDNKCLASNTFPILYIHFEELPKFGCELLFESTALNETPSEIDWNRQGDNEKKNIFPSAEKKEYNLCLYLGRNLFEMQIVFFDVDMRKIKETQFESKLGRFCYFNDVKSCWSSPFLMWRRKRYFKQFNENMLTHEIRFDKFFLFSNCIRASHKQNSFTPSRKEAKPPTKM